MLLTEHVRLQQFAKFGNIKVTFLNKACSTLTILLQICCEKDSIISPALGNSMRSDQRCMTWQTYQPSNADDVKPVHQSCVSTGKTVPHPKLACMLILFKGEGVCHDAILAFFTTEYEAGCISWGDWQAISDINDMSSGQKISMDCQMFLTRRRTIWKGKSSTLLLSNYSFQRACSLGGSFRVPSECRFPVSLGKE